ncbi:MAG: metal ABC transporter ATP-binding protein, partial [Acidobacteriota bacterium]
QRVLLALALALQKDPELLILDEPAAGLDYTGEQLLCGLLDSLRMERGFTQLMVTHDLSVVTAHATHVICLNRKVICEGSPDGVLSSRVLEATFGIHKGLPDPRGIPEETFRQCGPEGRCFRCRP